MLLFFLESFSCVEVASAKLTAKIRIFSLCYFLIASPFVCWFCVLIFEFHVFFRLIFSVLVLSNYCKIVLPSGLFCIVTSTHSFSRNSSFLQLKSITWCAFLSFFPLVQVWFWLSCSYHYLWWYSYHWRSQSIVIKSFSRLTVEEYLLSSLLMYNRWEQIWFAPWSTTMQRDKTLK